MLRKSTTSTKLNFVAVLNYVQPPKFTLNLNYVQPSKLIFKSIKLITLVFVDGLKTSFQ